MSEIIAISRPPLEAITTALDLLPARMRLTGAHLMLAIGYQESGFRHRRQLGNGPARGFWQFERGGGVFGVLRHASSREAARALCATRNVSAESDAAVWAALERDDVLAAGFARLLLWTDPRPLPDARDVAAGWDYYIRNWRPGRPHPERWPFQHARAWIALERMP